MRPAEGVKIVRREIPGAIPRQRYFYQNLNEDWLPFLEKEGLLGEPLPDEQMADLSRLRAWPAFFWPLPFPPHWTEQIA